MISSVSPTEANTRAAARIDGPANRSVNQPASAVATQCRVPRIGQVRVISPRSTAVTTSSTVPPVRTPMDHKPLARSWACMAR